MLVMNLNKSNLIKMSKLLFLLNIFNLLSFKPLEIILPQIDPPSSYYVHLTSQTLSKAAFLNRELILKCETKRI